LARILPDVLITGAERAKDPGEVWLQGRRSTQVG
jgi:hypothetical protein